MGRRKKPLVAPGEPRSGNVDPMLVRWMEMSHLLNTDSRGFGMTYSTQRALARTPIIAPIRQTFVNWGADFAQPQLSPYSIGWRIAKTNRRSPYTPADWRTIDEISEVIMRAGWEWFPGGFEAFVKSSINDTITHDQVNYEIIRENAPQGMLGKPWAFIPVDPATIRRAIPSDADLDDYRWDYEDIAYVQIMNNGAATEVVAEFSKNELGYGVRRPSSWVYRMGHGMPELEEYAPMIANFVNCITANSQAVATGVHIPQLLAIFSATEGKQWENFRMELQAMMTGTRNNRRQAVVKLNPGLKEDIKSVPVGASNEEMQFMPWMDFGERMVCAMYNIEQRVAFPKSTDVDRIDHDKMSPTDRALMSKERGFRPVLRALSQWINHDIVSWWPGFRFDFVGFDSQSERDKLEMDIKAVTTYLSPNELRAERNLPPYNDPVSNRPLNALYQSWIQSQVDEGTPVEGLEVGMDNMSAWVSGRRLPDVTYPA